MSSERVNLRSNHTFLIGPVSHQITGGKLPSNKQVMSVLFYNLQIIKLDVKHSAELVIKEVSVFWEKARIPTRRKDHCCEMLIMLYNDWRGLQKSASKTTEAAVTARSAFTDRLDDLFDIAHSLAESQMKIQEDIEFLRMQRMKGRPGVMLGVDINLHRAEKRTAERKEAEIRRKSRCLVDIDRNSLMAELLPSTSSSSSTGESEGVSDVLVSETVPSSASGVRGTLDFLNDRLAAVLDRCKISDRDAVHILVAAAEALGHDAKDLVVNRNSISRKRSQFRTLRYKEMVKNFNITRDQYVVVHWDGKLLPDVTKDDRVERLAVLISYDGKDKLIGAPSIQQASGREQASAVYVCLEEWGLLDSVQAMCFDTTASNTGKLNGACRNIENLLEKELLYLPCRHHIFEVVLKGVFEEIMGPASGPDVPIFSRFKNAWSQIDNKKYSSGTEDNDVKEAIPADLKKELLNFFFRNLKEKQLREDYRELMELAVIFLGETPPRGIRFRKPGAISHARWMSKAIYSLKIFLFRNEFKLSTREISSLKKINIFLTRVYLQAWYNATSAIKAPMSDLNFIQSLVHYEAIDSKVSNAAVKKFINHLWYLAPETAALGFFDDNVNVETKIKMVRKLTESTEEEEPEKENRYFLRASEVRSILRNDLSYFITPASLKLFNRFHIKMEFLQTSPKTWESNPQYLEGFNILKKIIVVNDLAERGIQLIQEYNSILSKNTEEKQFILQVVKDYREHYPSCSKGKLLRNFD